MPDYKEMYLTMIRETERAINILIDAQRRCEELYMDSREPDIRVIDIKNDHPE